jgi:flagellar basal body P-ring formation protein FlgA
MRTPARLAGLLIILLTCGWFSRASLAAGPSVPSASEVSPNRELVETEIKELLTAVLQREHVQDKGELELRFTRPWKTVSVPDEPITLKVLELPTSGVTPNFIVRFELSTASRLIGTYQVPVAAQVWREIWVARSPLTRGESLGSCDRTRERRDVLALRETLVSDIADPAQWRLAENLAAGAPLYESSVKLRALVHRGQVALAMVRNETMTVSLKVEVLEDGALGQQVRVRNIQSRREFRGKVEDETTILVDL